MKLSWRLPEAAVTGLDLSADMLAQARRKLATHPARITLIQWRYDQPLNPGPTFDLVIFSYCLTMINPGWERAVDAALRDLWPGGRLAVVDFHWVESCTALVEYVDGTLEILRWSHQQVVVAGREPRGLPETAPAPGWATS